MTAAAGYTLTTILLVLRAYRAGERLGLKAWHRRRRPSARPATPTGKLTKGH